MGGVSEEHEPPTDATVVFTKLHDRPSGVRRFDFVLSPAPRLLLLQMHNMHPRGLRTHSKLYNCVFMGERSQDAGGPYRESWSMYAQELQVLA